MSKETKEIKIEQKEFYCRSCGKKLKVIQGGFDAMSLFLKNPDLMYCNNPTCVWVGIVVVMGVQKSK